MSDFEKWQAFAAGWGSLYCFAIFFVAVVYTMWPSRRKAFDAAALIPLKDD